MNAVDEWERRINLATAGKYGTTVALGRYTKSGSSANPIITYPEQTVAARVTGYDTKLIDGTVIKVGDVKVMMAVTDVTGAPVPMPSTLDRVMVNGLNKTIVRATQTFAADLPSEYEIQAR